MDPATLSNLADDMAANGLLQRIGLIGPSPDGRYEIGWGDRRCAAAKLLRWPAIAAKVYPHGTSPLDVRAAENLQREQLTPIEEALMVKELLDDGAPVPEVMRRFRRSDSWVRERLALLALPDDLRGAIHHGELAVNVAVALAEIDHEEYRRSLVDEAERTGASRRVIDVWVAHYKSDRDRIVQNHLTVAAIVQARAAYVIYYPCDACGVEVEYTTTRAWRLCPRCHGELAAAVHDGGSSVEHSPTAAATSHHQNNRTTP
jgi:ParB/RepB/Spo0J family partition protein